MSQHYFQEITGACCILPVTPLSEREGLGQVGLCLPVAGRTKSGVCDGEWPCFGALLMAAEVWGQLWWLLQHWAVGRGPGLIRNCVRGVMGKAAKNALSLPDWLFWPQADPCLYGWGQINWLINYPGKLDIALGSLGAPHIFSAECQRAFQLHWLRDWGGHSLPRGLFEQLSSVVSMFSLSARFTPYLLGNFLPLVPFSLSCFAQFQNCQSYSSEI